MMPCASSGISSTVFRFRKMIGDLTEDVTIHVLADEMSKDEDLDNTLQQIKSLSKHVKVDYIDPLANPKFYSTVFRFRFS